MFVQELMTREPATVTADTHVKTAVDLLARRQVSSLPVVDARGRIRGILSEVDLIRDAIIPDVRAHLLPEEGRHRNPATRVSEVMTSPAITVNEKTDLTEVVELMATARLKSLPVVDNEERVVGIISRSDIIRTRARRPRCRRRRRRPVQRARARGLARRGPRGCRPHQGSTHSPVPVHRRGRSRHCSRRGCSRGSRVMSTTFAHAESGGFS